MKCPMCRNPDTDVKDSRRAEDGKRVRRRRRCQKCGARFTTMERPAGADVKEDEWHRRRKRDNQIIAGYATGETQAALASRFDLTEIAILRIIHRDAPGLTKKLQSLRLQDEIRGTAVAENPFVTPAPGQPSITKGVSPTDRPQRQIEEQGSVSASGASRGRA